MRNHQKNQKQPMSYADVDSIIKRRREEAPLSGVHFIYLSVF